MMTMTSDNSTRDLRFQHKHDAIYEFLDLVPNWMVYGHLSFKDKFQGDEKERVKKFHLLMRDLAKRFTGRRDLDAFGWFLNQEGRRNGKRFHFHFAITSDNLTRTTPEVVCRYLKRNDRPELQKAIALARKSKGVLVIAKLDRLSRNAAFLLTLQDSGVDFIACDMPSADKFSIGILALMAQRERELISQRTKAGLAVVRAKGVKLGNPNMNAMRKNALRAVKEQKTAFAGAAIKVIREIQSTGVATLAKIADCLNKRGEKTPRGGKWTATAVKRVLECAA